MGMTIEELVRGQWAWRIGRDEYICGEAFASRDAAIREAIASRDYEGNGDGEHCFLTCFARDEPVRLSELFDWESWLDDLSCNYEGDDLSDCFRADLFKADLQEKLCDWYGGGGLLDFRDPDDLLPELTPVALASLAARIKEALDAGRREWTEKWEIPEDMIPGDYDDAPLGWSKALSDCCDRVKRAIDEWQLERCLRFVQPIYMEVMRSEDHCLDAVYGAERKGRERLLGYVEVSEGRFFRCVKGNGAMLVFPWLAQGEEPDLSRRASANCALADCSEATGKRAFFGLEYFESPWGDERRQVIRGKFDTEGDPPGNLWEDVDSHFPFPSAPPPPASSARHRAGAQ